MTVLGSRAGGHAMPAEVRRNFRLCVVNGAVTSMGAAFFAYETVMAGLAYHLTRSAVLVGLLTSVAAVGWQWPQVIVGNRIEHVERKMPVYLASVLVRLAGIAAMMGALALCGASPRTLYWLLLGGTVLFSSGGGICVIPFMDIVAKTIPEHHRPMLFAYRRLYGGLLGFAAGLAAVYVLSPASGLTFPHNYAVLLLAGFSMNALGYAAFLGTSESVEPVLPVRTPFRVFLRRGASLFRRDRNFRRYFEYRVFLAVGGMSEALFVAFTVAQFSAPIKTTGGFAATVALVAGISSIFWGRVSQRYGETVLFRVSTALLLLAPSSALAMSLLAQARGTTVWITAHYIVVCLFMFGSQTAARCGIDIAGTLFMLALPPPEQRPIYMAFMNTLSAPLMALPLLAGVIAAASSYTVTFALSCAATLCALGLAMVLRRA